MTAAAVRRPRVYWEQTLARLLAPVMAEPRRVHTWKRKFPLAPYPIVTGEFEVVEIHVFGSFARGAAESGDLDVLVVVDTHGTNEPDAPVVKRALFGQARQVQVYADRAESTVHRKEFPEHRLVWSREASNLEQNLAAIPVVSGAGRFERKTDRLPFPLEVFDTHPERVEAVIDAIDAGEIISSIIPLETITASPEKWNEWWRRHAYELLESSRPSVPHVLQYLVDRSELPFVDQTVGRQRRTTIHANGFYTLFRRPFLDRDPLSFMSVTSYLLVPDVPRSCKAGIWRLDRGPSHPMVKAFEDVELWCIGQGESPALITERKYHGESEGWVSYTDRLALHAYGSHALATEALGPWKKKRAKATVVQLRGAELIRWIARVEEVIVNGSPIDVDHRFGYFLEQMRGAHEGSRPFTFERGSEAAEEMKPTEFEGVYRLATGELLIRGVRKDRESGRLLVVTKSLTGDVGEEDASIQLFVEEAVGRIGNRHGAR